MKNLPYILLLLAVFVIIYTIAYAFKSDDLEVSGIENYSETVGLAQFRENEE